LKILVTGGAGFIGSNVVDAFLKAGNEVVIVDNLSTGFRRNVNEDAIFYEADIRDYEKLQDIFASEKPDIVDHHAAQIDVRKSVDYPAFDAETNILGSINLIKLSVEYKVKKFIYVSTGGAVYGEPEFLPVSEEHPINPICNYGISKHTVEHYLYLYKQLDGLNYTVLRYPNVYGPRQDPKGEAGVNAIFINQMLSGEIPRIFGDGEQLRDYVFVGDIVQVNFLALKKGNGGTYNIASGIATSVNDVFNEIKNILGFKNDAIYEPARKGEIYKIYLDASKARKELGWEPKTSFHQGLVKTIEWHRQIHDQ